MVEPPPQEKEPEKEIVVEKKVDEGDEKSQGQKRPREDEYLLVPNTDKKAKETKEKAIEKLNQNHRRAAQLIEEDFANREKEMKDEMEELT